MSELLTPENLEHAKKCLHVSFLANGGLEWSKKNCRCEPEIGRAPCDYCAIQSGLHLAESLIGHLESQARRVEEVTKERDKWREAAESIYASQPRALKLVHELRDLRSQLSTAKEAIRVKDELESKITHPQIHADYYKWRSTLSIVDKMFLATCDKDGLVMWAWSRSRETMKEQNQLGPSKEFQAVMNNGTTEEIKADLHKPQKALSAAEGGGVKQ